MADTKFKVAVGIIVVLTVVLIFITVVQPSYQGYVVKNQIESQQEAVSAIIQIVNNQGYVILSDNTSTIVLSRNPQLEAELEKSLQGSLNGEG